MFCDYIHNYRKELSLANPDIRSISFKIFKRRLTADQAESAVAYQKRTRAKISDFTMMEELVIEHLNSVQQEPV